MIGEWSDELQLAAEVTSLENGECPARLALELQQLVKSRTVELWLCRVVRMCVFRVGQKSQKKAWLAHSPNAL